MVIRVSIIFLSLLIMSCAKHHEMEKVTLDIANCNKLNVDSVFLANGKHTFFFTDSILQGNKPSNYFYNKLSFFSGEYVAIIKRENLINRKYYSNLNYDGSKIVITLSNTKNVFENIDFYFENENDIWILNGIEKNQ